MTVEELIDKLQCCDPKAKVRNHWDEWEVVDIETRTIGGEGNVVFIITDEEQVQ